MIRVTSYVERLYGKRQATRIQNELQAYAETLPKETYREDVLWYKSANMYVVYPDAIGGKKEKPLDNLIDFLPHIKATGFHAIHVLPFLDSPMYDGGFDVKDFYTVRKNLGTMEDIQRLRKTARSLGLRLFMDLIFNHVSKEHTWFQKAIGGSKIYRNYFIHTKVKPIFLRKIHKKAAVWAVYLVNGKERMVNIAFPEFAGAIPHWTQAEDGYWYYHTYRPDQLDINWKNPDVFLACAKVLIFWANKGFHFRLDAIPFVGKSAYKKINSRGNFTHHLLAALNHIAKQVNPECVFILETYEHLDTVIGYLGKQNVQQAELLYGFHLCTSLWVSLVKKDTQHIWQALKKIQKIPTFAQWINFLRNHDELSLAYLNSATLHDVQETLLPNGKSFREGYGIAGRTFSLLGEDTGRFFMAYFLLFSLPGGILIPYGDEFAKKNTVSPQVAKDARNIHRGMLTESFLKEHMHGDITQTFSHLMHVRRTMQQYFAVYPRKLPATKDLFHAEYILGNSRMKIIINTSEHEKKIACNLAGYKKIAQVNEAKTEGKSIFLGPYGGLWLLR